MKGKNDKSEKSIRLRNLMLGANRPLSATGRFISDVFQALVLILSLALIVFISYDTFENIPFLENHRYMEFQFWVCNIFLLSFFVDLVLVPDKKAYLKSRWFFLLISIPYLNIIHQIPGLNMTEEELYYIRFIPLVRGGYALSMVVGYISLNRAFSLLAQYFVILLSVVYIASMIFYYEEHPVNPDVNSFWDALYWSSMNVTTVGCYFSAITPVGKVISVVLPVSGTLILPLFTVVIIDKVKSFSAAAQPTPGDNTTECSTSDQ